MGNTNSIKSAKIILDYDNLQSPSGAKLTANAGESLCGSLQIEINRPIQNLSGVYLQMLGKESTYIPSKAQSDHVYQRQIVEATYPVKEDVTSLPRGKHTIPFNLMLPNSIPSTMNHGNTKNRHQCSCRIEYSLEAFTKNSINGQIAERFGKRSLTVSAQPLSSDTQTKYVMEPLVHKMKSKSSWLFRRKGDDGNIIHGAYIPNTQVGKGQELQIKIASKNNSTVKVDGVKIRLIENISYGSQHSSNKNDCCRKHFTKVIAAKHIGTHHPSFFLTELRKRQDVVDNMEHVYNQLVSNELSSEINMIHVHVPIDAQNTYPGTLITTSHWLEITYETKGKDNSNNPCLRIPITIGEQGEKLGRGCQGQDYHSDFVMVAASSSTPSAPIEFEDIDDDDYVGGPSAPFEDDLYDGDDAQNLPVATAMPLVLENENGRPLSNANCYPTIVSIPPENVIIGGSVRSEEVVHNNDSIISISDRHHHINDDSNSGSNNNSSGCSSNATDTYNTNWLTDIGLLPPVPSTVCAQ